MNGPVPEPTEIQERICRFLAARCHVPLDELSGDTRFEEDLGLDSFDLVELLIEVEDAYGVVITDAEATLIHSISDAAALIASRTPG